MNLTLKASLEQQHTLMPELYHSEMVKKIKDYHSLTITPQSFPPLRTSSQSLVRRFPPSPPLLLATPSE